MESGSANLCRDAPEAGVMAWHDMAGNDSMHLMRGERQVQQNVFHFNEVMCNILQEVSARILLRPCQTVETMLHFRRSSGSWCFNSMMLWVRLECRLEGFWRSWMQQKIWDLSDTSDESSSRCKVLNLDSFFMSLCGYSRYSSRLSHPCVIVRMLGAIQVFFFFCFDV